MRCSRFISIAVSAFLVFASCRDSVRTPNEADAIQANRAFTDAWLDGDNAQLERMLPQEFVLTEDSSVYDREAYLAPLRAGDVKMTSWTSQDLRARMYGQVGVVTGRWSLSGLYKNSPYTHVVRFTCIWCVRGDVWELVAAHLSTIGG